MKYFLDTEFVEGIQDATIPWLILKKRAGGLSIGKPKPTIDLISIGIVAEDGREYYAISKDFNLKEAWNRFDIKKEWYSIDESNQSTRDIKVYWIRENVLIPLMQDAEYRYNFPSDINNKFKGKFDYKDFKYIISKYGKSNKQIAEEINKFITSGEGVKGICNNEIKFYGYYADYDWVVFCWLFGKMINLPAGFLRYCIDLKQMMDEVLLAAPKELFRKLECNTCKHNVLEYLEHTGEAYTLKFRLDLIKEKHPNYPKQTNEHNALFDARWNRDLYNFLIKI